jgi:hypothetical protein
MVILIPRQMDNSAALQTDRYWYLENSVSRASRPAKTPACVAIPSIIPGVIKPRVLVVH